MLRYSEDTFGARALNWLLLFGAALLFATMTYASVGPGAEPDAQQVSVTSPAAHG